MAVDPRERRREGSRRAQAARAKREDAKKKRKNRNLMFGIGGVLVAIASIAGLVTVFGGGPDIGVAVDTQPGQHYNPENFPAFEYNTSPPSSGPHYPRWSSWGFLGMPLDPHEVVHNMEHGGVVIWYQPDSALAGQVNQLVRELGNQCVVAGSYTEMPATVAVTAWGRILELESFDGGQIREFVQAYRGDLGPEAGLCRTDL